VPAILIASSRKGDSSDPTALWADVLLAVRSALYYGGADPVVLAWQGPVAPPDLPDDPRLTVLRQPDACRSFGEAYAFAAAATDARELVLLNDDAVLLPDTLRLLLEDVALLRRDYPQLKIGYVCCRSNVAPGAQNVRAPNGGALRPNGMRFDSEDRILALDRVSPICGWLHRDALEAIGGFPPINWFSDDLMCWDLGRRGYRHFVSRAYVHHVGMRSTLQGRTQEDLLREGQAWLREHRPDFWKAIGGEGS
jgi:hypothetical protein